MKFKTLKDSYNVKFGYDKERPGQSLTEGVSPTPELEEAIKKVIGLYAEKLSLASQGSNVVINTIIRDDVPNKEKAHNEMIATLNKNNYKVADDFYLYNDLLKQHTSYITISAAPSIKESSKKCCDKEPLSELFGLGKSKYNAYAAGFFEVDGEANGKYISDFSKILRNTAWGVWKAKDSDKLFSRTPTAQFKFVATEKEFNEIQEELNDYIAKRIEAANARDRYGKSPITNKLKLMFSLKLLKQNFNINKDDIGSITEGYKLKEDYTVKFGHAAAERKPETFDTLEDAVKFINDGIKKKDSESFILVDDSGKEMIWLDNYRNENNVGVGYTISRHDDKKSIEFDTSKGILKIKDNTPEPEDNKTVKQLVVSQAVKTKNASAGQSLNKLRFVLDNSEESHIDIEKGIAYFNDYEGIPKMTQTLIKKIKETKNSLKEDYEYPTKGINWNEAPIYGPDMSTRDRLDWEKFLKKYKLPENTPHPAEYCNWYVDCKSSRDYDASSLSLLATPEAVKLFNELIKLEDIRDVRLEDEKGKGLDDDRQPIYHFVIADGHSGVTFGIKGVGGDKFKVDAWGSILSGDIKTATLSSRYIKELIDDLYEVDRDSESVQDVIEDYFNVVYSKGGGYMPYTTAATAASDKEFHQKMDLRKAGWHNDKNITAQDNLDRALDKYGYRK